MYQTSDIKRFEDGYHITTRNPSTNQVVKLVGPFTKKYLAEREIEILNANRSEKTTGQRTADAFYGKQSEHLKG